MTKIHLSRDAPVILIDASYFAIHRLFATSRWWSMKNTSQLAGNEAFVEALIKHSEADVTKIQKKWGLIGRGNKAIAPNNIIFCQDCPPSSIWRIQVYGEYKRRYRTDPSQDVTYKTDSPSVSDSIRVHGHHAVAHPSLEADDVVCLLHRQVRAVMGQAQDIVIISSDHDFLQLKDDHCNIFSLPFKDIWPEGLKKGTADINRKILMGDVSDDIPAVLTKKQINLYMGLEERDREAYLCQLGCYQAFERNMKLMCWKHIPDDLVEGFNQNWMIEGSLHKN
jgi:5'-3' exonuclease